MAPSRKITSVALAGALTTIVVWLASLGGVEVPGQVAAATTTVLAFLAGYIVAD